MVCLDRLHRPALLAHDRPVHHGRRRHGARVRALRQRRARLGAHRPGRPGLRREQRDPRGRRRVRVAVLASVFTGAGGYASPQAFVNGLIPALWVGVAVLAAGAFVVLVLPVPVRSRRARAAASASPAAAGDRPAEIRWRGRGRSAAASESRARRGRPAATTPRRLSGAARRRRSRRRAPRGADRSRRARVRARRPARHPRGAHRATRGRRPALRVQPVPHQARPVPRRAGPGLRAGRRHLPPAAADYARGARRRSARTCCRRWASPTRSCSPPTATT